MRIIILFIMLSGHLYGQANLEQSATTTAASDKAVSGTISWQFSVGEPIIGSRSLEMTQPTSTIWYQGFLSPKDASIVLPIRWLDFTGKVISRNQHLLTWEVLHDGRNEYFMVERSKDGTHFNLIGEVSGQGVFNEETAYEFISEPPTAGLWYYRIKQIDYDGFTSFSNIIALDMASQDAELAIFPTPARTVLYYQWSSFDAVQQLAQMSIFDLKGQVVLRNISVNELNGEIDLTSLPPGMYFYQVINEAGAFASGKVIKI